MIVEEESVWKQLVRRLFARRRSEPPPPPTREELVDALAKVDRQLEILRLGPLRSGNDFPQEIAELETVRAGLAQSLADLGAESPSSP